MSLEESPENFALRENLVTVTDAVEGNLTLIGQCLEKDAFMTGRQVRNIVNVPGETAEAKAGKLVGAVQTKIRTASNPEEWFEKFVFILSRNTAENDLVKKLVKDFGKLNRMWYAAD